MTPSKILTIVTIALTSVTLSAELTAKPRDRNGCEVLDHKPEPTQNESGSVKVQPNSPPDVCYFEIEGKNILSFFYQSRIVIESAKRTNVVMRFAQGKDKPACQKALQDGPYYKGSIVVDQGLNEETHFMTSVRTGDIIYQQDAYICIHIENP